MHVARRLWLTIEPIHAVTYFAAERADAADALGLRGFWRSYFAFRAAPLGAVGAGTVIAAFGNFAPAMVQRAVPAVWDVASPADVVQARAAAAASSLRRLAPVVAEAAAATAVEPLRTALAGLAPIGRPLFASNAEIAPDDPVAALWQCCTTAREHRGDGHVAALVAYGLDGVEAHVLAAATSGTDPSLLRDNRGWTPGEWDAAVDRLRDRNALGADGTVTSEGRALHTAVEERTDQAAGALVAALARAGDAVDAVDAALAPVADAVVASGELPFPNPMGLPRRTG